MESILKGYITTTEAAELVGLDPSQVRRLVDTGKIEGFKAGRNWLVEIGSLEHYVKHSGHYRARRRKEKTANK